MLRVLTPLRYSRRAAIVALFIAFALLLGGGGSNNPGTELVLQLIFAVVACAWIWAGAGGQDQGGGYSPALLAVACLVLAVPILQLIPLPPGMWHALPGRDAEVASLALVGQENSWRPMAMARGQAIAALLAMIPPVLLMLAVSRLGTKERQMVLAVVLVLVIASAVLGVFQIAAPSSRLNIYEQFSEGWVTGFQANRNSAADVLAIGILCLALLVAPYFGTEPKQPPLGLTRKSLAAMSVGAGLFLTAALVMTGSRAGIVLGVGALVSAIFIVMTDPAAVKKTSRLMLAWMIAVPALLLIAGATLALGGKSEITRVLSRFHDLSGNRIHLWQDTWYALKQAWPFGVGIGGFEPAIAAAERLEVVDNTYPNRAHNEFLEMGLEAGILGYGAAALIGLLILSLAWRTWSVFPFMRRQVVFSVSALAVLVLHSLVDYPLRAMSLACLAGLAVGMMVATRDRPRPNRHSPLISGEGQK